ncbi:unnamed protein product [Triticum turgidum subsp. durum]|uniref:Uncharacterized protein n=1 Tax=Triticum turgidum subsp. durum TaxID=4567 RepID=A0A9R1NSN4_TRITD|nr:unnamed protein product [Triticum turgidum subsp. durum]
MPYPPSAPKAATADSLYGVYSEHVAAMATSPPPPAVAGPQALETGTKLHISNLDSSVTVEDVQVLAVLLLLLLLRSMPIPYSCWLTVMS